MDTNGEQKILEIGCGPGALAGALHHWYPKAEITAIDRDTEFIRFAGEHEKGINFLEGDATNLPFGDSVFDVTISNTVAEHIEPERFYAEQLRVLKPGGICLVLSSRKGIQHVSDCVAPDAFEQDFWAKVEKHDDSMEKYAVCKYPMSEAEMPVVMEQHGLREVSTGYAVVDLTPDDPKYPPSMAIEMIEASRYSELEAVRSVLYTMPEQVTPQAIQEMERRISAKYDARLRLYARGEKQWDTSVSVIMVLRGIK